MAVMQEWSGQVALADQKLRDAEKEWAKARTGLEAIQHQYENPNDVSLGEAIATVAKSFRGLKQRSRIIAQFGGEDVFVDHTLEHLIFASCGQPRSTETGNSQLHRATANTQNVVHQFHSIQNDREQRLDRNFTAVRERHSYVAILVGGKGIAKYIEEAEPALQVFRKIDRTWTPQLAAMEEWQDLETGKLDRMIACKGPIMLHGAMEYSIWAFLACLPGLGIKIPRQMLMDEFLGQHQRYIDVKPLKRSLEEMEARVARRGEPRLRQRRLTEFLTLGKAAESGGGQTKREVELLRAELRDTDCGEDATEEAGI